MYFVQICPAGLNPGSEPVMPTWLAAGTGHRLPPSVHPRLKPMFSSDLFTYDLDQCSLPPPPVKLAVEDALPGAKVEAAVGHRHHHLTAHHLPLQVRFCIVLAGAVVPVLLYRRVWYQLLESHLVIVVQAALVIVDEHTRSNVHRRYKGQYPLYHIPLSCP